MKIIVVTFGLTSFICILIHINRIIKSNIPLQKSEYTFYFSFYVNIRSLPNLQSIVCMVPTLLWCLLRTKNISIYESATDYSHGHFFKLQSRQSIEAGWIGFSNIRRRLSHTGQRRDFSLLFVWAYDTETKMHLFSFSISILHLYSPSLFYILLHK